MNIQNLSWLTRAPLLLAAAALAACSSDEQPTAQAEPEQHQWTLVVSVDKTDAPIVDATRGVGTDDGGETLASKWDAGTTVEVYDEEDNRVGTLLADASDNGTTQLRGTISGTYTPGVSTLQLYSPSKTLDYSGQDGSISGDGGISTKDFVYGTISVQSVNMRNNMMTTDDCQFTRLQAFAKFTFDYPMKTLQITAEGLESGPLTVTTTETQTTTFYVALRNTPGVKRQYDFYGTSSDGTTTFIGTKYGTLQHGDYSTASVLLQPSLGVTATTSWTDGETLDSGTLTY